MPEIQGLHHVTAICGPAQENYDFYSRVLGLRLVKRTVNYEDERTYHLYYGDGAGTPGTILTFFPYPDARPGRPGRGHINSTALEIPREAATFWIDRLRSNDVEMDKPQSRDGNQVIGFRAPDGLCLELIGLSDFQPTVGIGHPGIPAAKAIGALRSVSVAVDNLVPSHQFLTQFLGATLVAEKDNRHSYQIGTSHLDLNVTASGPPGRGGHGSVHHVAFSIESDEAQLELREQLVEAGVKVSGVLDRTYFKSIYFNEPGGSLFEVATAQPGFLVDEPIEHLGRELQLPSQFALKRRQIERILPALEIRK